MLDRICHFSRATLAFAGFALFAIGANAQSETTMPTDPVVVPVPLAGQQVPLNWSTGQGISYREPALEVPGFLAALSIYDRIAIPHDVYDSTFQSSWEHLHEQHRSEERRVGEECRAR